MKSLDNITGTVVEICSAFPNKAILEFAHAENSGRAILWSSRLYVKGKPLPSHTHIKDYLNVGFKVTFSCHMYSNPNNDDCQWFVISAYSSELDQRELESLGLHTLETIDGLKNQTGVITQITKRQAIISFTNEKTVEQGVLLLASKFYFHNKRISAALTKDLRVDDEIKFDAVPFEDENSDLCNWIATVAWIGLKPTMPYDVAPFELPKCGGLESYKSALNNPNSKFLCSQGKIIKVLSNEYAVCICQVKDNNWQTVLFHRSAVHLFGCSLGAVDLQKIFMPGDRIRFLAIPTSLDSIAQWAARQVFVDTTNEY